MEKTRPEAQTTYEEGGEGGGSTRAGRRCKSNFKGNRRRAVEGRGPCTGTDARVHTRKIVSPVTVTRPAPRDRDMRVPNCRRFFSRVSVRRPQRSSSSVPPLIDMSASTAFAGKWASLPVELTPWMYV